MDSQTAPEAAVHALLDRLRVDAPGATTGFGPADRAPALSHAGRSPSPLRDSLDSSDGPPVQPAEQPAEQPADQPADHPADQPAAHAARVAALPEALPDAAPAAHRAASAAAQGLPRDSLEGLPETFEGEIDHGSSMDRIHDALDDSLDGS